MIKTGHNGTNLIPSKIEICQPLRFWYELKPGYEAPLLQEIQSRPSEMRLTVLRESMKTSCLQYAPQVQCWSVFPLTMSLGLGDGEYLRHPLMVPGNILRGHHQSILVQCYWNSDFVQSNFPDTIRSELFEHNSLRG